MAEYTVKIPDEAVLDYIRTIDGDPDNDTLIQRVMDGHYMEWYIMFMVKEDRALVEDFVHSKDEVKASIRAVLSEAKLAEEISEEIILKDQETKNDKFDNMSSL